MTDEERREHLVILEGEVALHQMMSKLAPEFDADRKPLLQKLAVEVKAHKIILEYLEGYRLRVSGYNGGGFWRWKLHKQAAWVEADDDFRIGAWEHLHEDALEHFIQCRAARHLSDTCRWSDK